MAIIEIHMPDGENEGTEASLSAWLKAVGDSVHEHEPLLEISTDKVTLEIGAPGSGILRSMLKAAGDSLQPGELLGTMEAGAVAAATPPPLPPPAEKPTTPELTTRSDSTYSPVVRRLLAELELDPRTVSKAGRGGRLTPLDIAAHLRGSSDRAAAKSLPTPPPPPRGLPEGRRVPHTPMRRSIANHMAGALQAAPHVTAVFEADLSRVLADRQTRKLSAGADGVPSITAYLIRAAIEAIGKVPEVNSRWHETYLEVFDRVNFGVGTALDSGGLVVPVLRDAQCMDLESIAAGLRVVTTRARSGRLTQAEMDGGTFTISNHGVGGSLLASPIVLPHGQAAILGAGKLQKRVIVCESAGRELFRVRPMMYVTLTVDHRVLDGQQTNGFLTEFVRALEEPADR